MARKNIPPDSTISQKPTPISPRFMSDLSFRDAALEYISMRERTFDEREVMNLCTRLIEWVADPIRTRENYKMGQFFRGRGISKESVATLKRNWPQFARAYEFAMETLGSHREWMGLHHEWDTKMVMFTMPMYDAEWKEETIRLAKLKQLETMEQGIKVVHVPVYIDKEPPLTIKEEKDE